MLHSSYGAFALRGAGYVAVAVRGRGWGFGPFGLIGGGWGCRGPPLLMLAIVPLCLAGGQGTADSSSNTAAAQAGA